MTKTCSRCRKEQSVDAFHKSSVNKDGRSGQCRACRTEIQRERRATDPDYRRRQQESNLRSTRRRYKPHPPQPRAVWGSWEAQRMAAACVRSARRQAARLGAAVNDLTLREWEAIVVAAEGRCFYCHKPAKLEIEHRIPLYRGGPNTASNVVAGCRPCNWKKHLRSDEQFMSNRCSNDHDMTPENTYTYPDGRKTACRRCQRASQLRYRQRKKARST